MRYLISLFVLVQISCAQDLTGDFRLVLHVSREHLSDFIHLPEGSVLFFDYPFVKESSEAVMFGVAFYYADGGRNVGSIACLTETGEPIHIYPMPEVTLLPGLSTGFQIRALDSIVYLAAPEGGSFKISCDSLAECANPWSTRVLSEKFPLIPFDFSRIGFANVAMFRISENLVCTIDSEGVFTKYEKGGAVKKSLSIDTVKEFLSYVTWQDPIIGIYDGDLFLWNDELLHYNFQSKKTTIWAIDRLIANYDIGDFETISDYSGRWYFANSKTFYLFLHTDKGIWFFEYIPD